MLEVEGLVPIAMTLGPLFSMTNLTPGTQRNINSSINAKSLDRTTLIWTFLHKGRNQFMPVPK